MKQANGLIICARSWCAGRIGALTIGWAVVWMASGPSPAWGQSAWPGYPNNTAISVTSGGNVGIGTGPAFKLDIWPQGDAQVRIASYGGMSGDTSGGFMVGENIYRDWTGTYRAFVTHPGLGGAGIIFGSAYTSFVNYTGASSMGATVSPTVNMAITSAGNVGIGTTAPQYKLAVNGTIGAKDVIVTNSGWSDYVFRPGYRLRPLSEVGAYIETHQRLPDIPSEAEVKEKGVSLGEMQAKLLAKIEELTLHMIQQEKDNRELRERIAQLENRSAGSTALAAGR